MYQGFTDADPKNIDFSCFFSVDFFLPRCIYCQLQLYFVHVSVNNFLYMFLHCRPISQLGCHTLAFLLLVKLNFLVGIHINKKNSLSF